MKPNKTNIQLLTEIKISTTEVFNKHSKCKVMYFGNKNKKSDYLIDFNNQHRINLDVSECERELCEFVTFWSNLKI